MVRRRTTLGVLLAVAALGMGCLARSLSRVSGPSGGSRDGGSSEVPAPADVAGLAGHAGRGPAPGPSRAHAAPLASSLPAAYAPERRPAEPYAFGIVVNDSGAPLGGAEVEITLTDGRGSPGRETVGRTTTDDAGYFVVPCPSPRSFQEVRVRARHGALISAAQKVALGISQTLEVGPSVRVEGRVLEAETGRALEGAFVSVLHLFDTPRCGESLEDEVHATGPDGRFAFETRRYGLHVAGWHEGHRRVTSLPPDDAAESAELVLRLPLEPRRTIRGRLLDGEVPVAGALVSLLDLSLREEGAELASVRTDGAGSFAFEASREREYAVGALVGGRRASHVVRGERQGETTRPVVLHLAPVVHIVGLVTRDGKPVPGIVVELGGVPMARSAVTGADGRYRIEDPRLPHRYAPLHVTACGERGSRTGVDVDLLSTSSGDLEAPTIRFPRAVRGHVRDEAGRPVPRALVGIPWAVGVVAADEEGAYLWFPNDERDASSCYAWAPGTLLASAHKPATDGSVDFTLERGGRLEGTSGFLDGVTITPLGVEGYGPVSPDHHGEWSFDRLPGATYRIRIEAPGRAPVERTGPLPGVVPPVHWPEDVTSAPR